MSVGSTSRSLNQFLPQFVQAQQVRSCAWSLTARTALVTATTFQRTKQIRTMATAAAGKKLEWLIIIPDHEGVIEKRLEVRAKHLEGVTPLHNENKIIMGGAMFSHPPKEGESPLPMVGSALLAYAESEEEVRKILENDIYTRSGVWDLSKVQIWPFKSAVRSDISTTSDLHPIQSARQGA